MTDHGVFTSIVTVDRAASVVRERLHTHGAADEMFLLTEKVHGACASVVLSEDGSVAKLRSRRRSLAADDFFYGFQGIAGKVFTPEVCAGVREAALKAYEAAVEDAASVFGDVAGAGAGTSGEPPVVSVFGEVYGGLYTHDDVETPPGTRHVQIGVHYSPHVHFCGFQVAVGSRYLPQVVALDILTSHGIETVPVLHEGTFDAVMALSEELLMNDETNATLIPARHGLPEIPMNRREGHVIAPARRLLPVRGSGNAGAHNFVKHVHPKFRESLGDLTAKPASRTDGLPKGLPAKPEVQAAWSAVLRHTTMMRASKTVGKFGLDKALIGAITAMMLGEVLEEAATELGERLGLDEELYAKVERAAKAACGRMVAGIVVA